MASQLELSAGSVGLVVIDIQEKLAEAMPDKVLKGTLRNWLNLIEAARVLELPVAVSEQYPEALGRSLPVVAESVLRLPSDQVFSFEKRGFACGSTDAFSAFVKRSTRKQWLLCGMETHISVYQTARAMVQAGHTVHVPRDAVISRTMANWEIGLRLIERAGAVVTSTETIVFDLIKEAGSEQFSFLSRVVK